MSSVDDLVVGQFMLPIIDANTKEEDPWQRNYFAPPQTPEQVSRSYPLTDIRPLLAQDGYSTTDMLQSYGFGIAKHRSPFLNRLQELQDEGLADQALAKEYFPEIESLVLQITGARRVFVTASALRQGARVPREYQVPTGLRPMSEASDLRQQSGTQEGTTVRKHKLAGQSKIALAAPVRRPHMDFTPLGARQTIRSQSRDILQAARDSGVIPFEDGICSRFAVRAPTREADPVIAEHYNSDGKLGPRYAAYSIWRPLRRVERDPLTLSPRRESPTADGEGVYWPYENKIPGPPELNGDFLKQFAMLGVRSEKRSSDDDESERMKWYYVSAQTPEEVLFIKLFDSAALGPDSQHASAPWHASPEIGDVAGTEPRESIDVRVLVFW